MTTTPFLTASDLTAGSPVQFRINGEAQTIVNVEQGPVWLNEARTHQVCPEGWLLITTSNGSRIPARPVTRFWFA